MKPAHPMELLVQLSCHTFTLEVEVDGIVHTIDEISSQIRKKIKHICNVNFKFSYYVFSL